MRKPDFLREDIAGVRVALLTEAEARELELPIEGLQTVIAGLQKREELFGDYPERTQARTALEAKLILLGQKAES